MQNNHRLMINSIVDKKRKAYFEQMMIIIIDHFTENKLVKEGFRVMEWNQVLANRS